MAKQRVGEAVMEFLAPKPGEAAPKQRNKRLTVVPGKAVSAEDVEQMEAAEKAQKEAKLVAQENLRKPEIAKDSLR